jgi:hypothetical protein
MQDLRSDLDDLCAYQAKHADAPAWFQMTEMLSRWGRENESFRRFQNTLSQNPPPIGEEDKDNDEDTNMEETMPHSHGTGDEATVPEEVGEIEVDDAVEKPELVEGVEAVESAGVNGGAKKKSLTSWVGRIARKTPGQDVSIPTRLRQTTGR